MAYYLLLTIGIILNVIAQLLVKSAALKIVAPIGSFVEKIKLLISNPSFTGAIVLYGLSFIIYTFVLTKLELSRAYPISSVGAIVLLLVISVPLFHEPLTAYKLAGVIASTIGIVLLFHS